MEPVRSACRWDGPPRELEPYERAMLDELKAMRFDGPITAQKVQRRLRVGFAKAALLIEHLRSEDA